MTFFFLKLFFFTLLFTSGAPDFLITYTDALGRGGRRSVPSVMELSARLRWGFVLLLKGTLTVLSFFLLVQELKEKTLLLSQVCLYSKPLRKTLNSGPNAALHVLYLCLDTVGFPFFLCIADKLESRPSLGGCYQLLERHQKVSATNPRVEQSHC